MDDSAATPEATYLTTKELALRWKTTRNAILIMRHKRRGPVSFKRGNRVLFEIAEVEAYEASLKAADSRHNTELDPTRKPVEMRGQQRPAA
jgi:hypothetical protein